MKKRRPGGRLRPIGKATWAVIGLLAGTAVTTVVSIVVTDAFERATRPDALEAIVTDKTPGASFLVPGPIGQVPRPPSSPPFRRCPDLEWAERLGGTGQGDTGFTVHLEGLSERTVGVDQVEVIIRDRLPLTSGVVVVCPPPAPYLCRHAS
jgi:hypothetical protein